MAVKYQSRAHKSFASYLREKEEAKLEEVYAAFPAMRGTLALKSTPQIDAIKAGNVEICRYFAVVAEEGEALEFDSEHYRSVKQTVRVNLNYYANVCQFLNVETDKDYAAIYKKIKRNLEEYFSTAAEDVLADVFGEEYVEFYANYLAEREKDKESEEESEEGGSEEE